MIGLNEARRAARNLKRIVDNSKVHTSEIARHQSRAILQFDGVLIEPCDILLVAQYIDTIKEYLECQDSSKTQT